MQDRATPMLEVRGLHADYTDGAGRLVHAVQGISFEVPEGKLFTLLGPSGCGKTTTMRCIAGLERPVAGDVLVRGEAVCATSRGIFVAPNKRNFGMVFQSYAIWPHMNVFENTAFPLRVGRQRLSGKEIEARVMRVLNVVGLDGFVDREATMLSGGQQQRLALARALAMEPRLLLLDEPLSNLDAKLRERMRFEIKRLQRELGLTTIYVTHDQGEALALSHEIAIINEGRIVQVGSPRDIYERPNSAFVADFVGLANFIDASVEAAEAEADLYRVASAYGTLVVCSTEALRAGEKVVVAVRPEDLELSETRPTGANVITGRVDLKVFLGESVDFQVKVGDRQLLARAHPSLRTELGATLHIRMNPRKCTALRPDA